MLCSNSTFPGFVSHFMNISFNLSTQLITNCTLLTEGDPENYLTYFRRATVFMAMGKSKSALPDLDKILEIRPDFVAVSIFVAVFFNQATG